MPGKPKPPSSDSCTYEPKISVICALPDHRDRCEEVLKSWLGGQDLSASEYEFLLISGPEDAHELERLSPFLRSQDRAWVELDDGILYLMHRGASEASGDILLFTESHCLAHPECLSAVARYFEERGHILGQCFHINFLENRYAELEQRLEGPKKNLEDEPYWNFVRKRAFAIRRSLYFEAGGFEHEFEYFSERAFARTLFNMGHRSEFILDALIFHYNTSSLSSMREHHEDYARGMCRYRETVPSHEAEQSFGPNPIWDEREWYRSGSRMQFLRSAFFSWLCQDSGKTSGFLKFTARSLVPLRMEIAGNWLLAEMAALLTKASRGAGDSAFHWYTQYWRRIVRGKQLRTVLEAFLDSKDGELDPVTGETRWPARDIRSLPHWGFFEFENLKEEFRWTNRFAMITLPPVRPDSMELVLKFHIASPDPVESGLDIRLHGGEGMWNPATRTWRCVVAKSSEPTPVAIICWNPRRFPGDSRELGIAVESIELLRAG